MTTSERVNSMSKRRYLSVVVLALAGLLAAGCGSSGGSSSTTAASGGGSSSGGSYKIALLFPCSTCTSWIESIAHPGMIADVKALDPNAQVIYENANGDEDKMVSDAESAIAQGAKVLIYETLTPATGTAIAVKAAAANIPVIAFDGMVQGPDVKFYVSFDNNLVGSLQGKYLIDNLPKGSDVAIVNGLDQGIGDVFKKGVQSALDPAFADGTLKKAFETDTDWDPVTGQTKMTQALTATNDQIAGVVATNDGLAGGVVAALQSRHLAGKVLVTGQDATIAGLQRILTGTQSMTVFKNIAEEVSAAAKVAVGLAQGKPDAVSSVATSTTSNGTSEVPSLILTPIAVTKANIQTVVDDKVFTWTQICNGIPASDCEHQ